MALAHQPVILGFTSDRKLCRVYTASANSWVWPDRLLLTCGRDLRRDCGLLMLRFWVIPFWRKNDKPTQKKTRDFIYLWWLCDCCLDNHSCLKWWSCQGFLGWDDLAKSCWMLGHIKLTISSKLKQWKHSQRIFLSPLAVPVLSNFWLAVVQIDLPQSRQGHGIACSHLVTGNGSISGMGDIPYRFLWVITSGDWPNYRLGCTF